MQGSAFYLGGATLVIVGWTIIGLAIEAYGFWLLFCEFFPVILQYTRKMPFLGRALDLPVFKMVSVLSFAGTAASAWLLEVGLDMLGMDGICS